jgi:MSHA type pilus biogenesis protein MshL
MIKGENSHNPAQENAAAQGSPAAGRQFRGTARRMGAWVCVLLLGACAYRPTVPPSEGHLSADRAAAVAGPDKILPPVTVSDFVPPPAPQVRLPTYSVVVNEVPIKELLFALARDTKQNIDIHPGVQGLVSLNAIDETLPAILDRLAKQVNVRYRNEGKTIVVMPDTPYFKTYRVNYINVSRDTTASIGVSGDISGGAGAGGGQSSPGSTGGTSSTKVETRSKNDFWDVLRTNIESILAATKALGESADQRAARSEAARTARQERIAQAEAAARAGATAPNLFATAFGPDTLARTDAKDEIIVNPVAGSVTILGTDKQQALVQQYLDGLASASQRQVLIEATIVEVQLSNSYQAGVDWSRIATGAGFTLSQQLAGGVATPPALSIAYANSTSDIGNISGTIRLLEQFGNTRVLSSPKLMTLNNQTALLKVVDNVVYFNIEAQTNTNQTTSTTTFTTTAKTVPVGLVMSVLPQVTDTGTVNLTVRPTISRIQSFVTDPNPSLRLDGQGNPLPLDQRVANLIPQIQVREMESVLQAGSGQTIILGGLMQDNVRRDRDQIPGVGSIPRVGEAFSFRDEAVSKTELIVFLKPTVVTNPSLASEELKFLQRFLPQIDSSGRTP